MLIEAALEGQAKVFKIATTSQVITIAIYCQVLYLSHKTFFKYTKYIFLAVPQGQKILE